MILRRGRSRPAFTLIELTLVTIIILALVGLSVPLFRKTFSGLAAKDATFNISKLINYAQERSVIDRKNYKIMFNFTANQYQLFESKQSTDKFIYDGDNLSGVQLLSLQGKVLGQNVNY